MSTFAISVGGGPAPGINGVIGAAATLACRRGHQVLGILDGFSRIMKGDTSQVVPSRIGNRQAIADEHHRRVLRSVQLGSRVQ